MARPRSTDKRNAILAAASRVMGELGLSAPTARIAREAGVAEGTLFTYFVSKDVLLNELYLELKDGLRLAMLGGYPAEASLEDRARHAWSGYVAWGLAHPQERKVMAKLTLSDRVTPETRATGSAAFNAITLALAEVTAAGPMAAQGERFVGAIMTSLADTTIEFVAAYPEKASEYAEAGFRAFWLVASGIAGRDGVRVKL